MYVCSSGYVAPAAEFELTHTRYKFSQAFLQGKVCKSFFHAIAPNLLVSLADTLDFFPKAVEYTYIIKKDFWC